MGRECAAEADKDVVLTADASDMLAMTTDDDQDLLAVCQAYALGCSHDLPDDPSEGLCIPSWHDLLDEAASQLSPEGPSMQRPAFHVGNSPAGSTLSPGPQGMPKLCPALDLDSSPVGAMPSTCPAASAGPQGFPWNSPAASEHPAEKRSRHGDHMDITWDADKLLKWDRLQEQYQIGKASTQSRPAHGTIPSTLSDEMHTSSERHTEAMHPPLHASTSAEHATVSDRVTDEAQQVLSMEIDSAVSDAQHASRAVPAPKHVQHASRAVTDAQPGQYASQAAAVQLKSNGPAKRAKRAPPGHKRQGKKTVSGEGQGRGQFQKPAQGQTLAAGQSQGKGHVQKQPQGPNGEPKPQGGSLGKLLPFDSVKVRTCIRLCL